MNGWGREALSKSWRSHTAPSFIRQRLSPASTPRHATRSRERASAAFDPTHLVDFRERLLLPHALPVDRISPLVKVIEGRGEP